MQARRSSLYAKKAPVIYFQDDFTTQTNGAFIDGTTASDGLGVWEDAAYTTDRIKEDPGSAHRVIPQNPDNKFCICHPKPSGEFAGATRLRCYIKTYLRNGVGLYMIVGAGFWSTTSRNTGVTWFAQKNTANAYAQVIVRLDANTKYQDDKIGIVNAWEDYELHAEKLSETSVKVGLKQNNVWIYSPTVHAVTAGFFAVPNKAQLFCRNSNGHSSGAMIDNITIDDQVDW
jgi:hypothetical protein